MLKENLDVITGSSSFLAGLVLSALTNLELEECLDNGCVARYYALYSTTLVWILTFCVSFVLIISKDKDDKKLETLLQILIYLGFTGLFLVMWLVHGSPI